MGIHNKVITRSPTPPTQALPPPVRPCTRHTPPSSSSLSILHHLSALCQPVHPRPPPLHSAHIPHFAHLRSSHRQLLPQQFAPFHPPTSTLVPSHISPLTLRRPSLPSFSFSHSRSPCRSPCTRPFIPRLSLSLALLSLSSSVTHTLLASLPSFSRPSRSLPPSSSPFALPAVPHHPRRHTHYSHTRTTKVVPTDTKSRAHA